MAHRLVPFRRTVSSSWLAGIDGDHLIETARNVAQRSSFRFGALLLLLLLLKGSRVVHCQ